jgi:CMP-N,N'-diacetyllegionaminic acid synthase
MPKEKILAIIPARGGSKGLIRKNIRLLDGKPLIAHSIEPAKQSKYINRIVVSTEDPEISQIALKFGAEVIKRPEYLAKDESPTADTVIHVIDELKKDNYSPDFIILLQPTSPLRTTTHIDEAIELFKKKPCELVVSVTENDYPPHWSYMYEEGQFVPLFNSTLSNYRRQDLPKTYRKIGAIFIFTPETVKKYNSFGCKSVVPYMVPSELSFDIDSEFNLKICEFILQNKTEMGL